jgi:hypothetical protein
MTQAISRWVPSSTVTTHTGQPVPSDWIFFTAPPMEIGAVYTAFSGWLGGSSYNAMDRPTNDDPYHFALAAETAWSKYMLDAVNQELKRTGSYRFNLKGSNYVMTGPGFIDLSIGGQKVRCMVDEIAKVELIQGVVSVRRKDAEDGLLGIGSTGTFKFNYSDLANGRVFMMLLDQLVGIS